MGMFDDIKYEMACPKCGYVNTDWQSKSGPCALMTLSTSQLMDLTEEKQPSFYTSCKGCKVWLEVKIGESW